MAGMQRIALAIATTLTISAGFAAGTQGPGSSQTPYVTPTAAGWHVTSIISVGDAAANGYRMVGFPDGLGAYDNGNGTFTVLMNHELAPGAGIARAHGATGAFVSEWVINKADFKVIRGADLATTHYLWNRSANRYEAATGAVNSFNRLCSADLPATSAFYDKASGKGTTTRLFMTGEEAGSDGRAYAFIVSGTNKGKAYELPKLGKFSWENSVANPYSGDDTIVIGTDDSTPGQVYIYRGAKTDSGLEIDKAGLTNGTLAGVKVAPNPAITGNLESGQINGTFSTVAVDTAVDGATQQANSRAAGITEFARPEDGAWVDAKTFYFVTTGADPDGPGSVGMQTSHLYKLVFDEARGEVDYGSGSITMVKDSDTLIGTDGKGARKFDNMTVGEDGKVYIQEDPGDSAYISKTWMFDPASNSWKQILESDRARFLAPAAPFNHDEESSGIIEITSILGRNDGRRYFLANAQAHYGIPGELVQGGQLYVINAGPQP
ncbi:uncharacterized protein DUF839 [Nitrosospira sp. Nsp2]|uniref:alkaline phosphatase PhoX n=1 Tax=Nitrosospira sp. Nsp2 TaxID=136548 RepID=UPI000D303F56|nr:alkaline phosphatase PhoX [Nitrosospira sp. Nsp2]PTR17337.1 uncharacterized protein DUF839 [Nitrosospira sp. Nsp2]